MPDPAINKFYPYLGGDDAASEGLPAMLLESVCSKSAASAQTQQQFLQEQGQALLDTAQALAAVFRNKGRLLCMGNGGSSCDAAHVAVEFNHPVTTGRVALPAINLTSDVSMLTAVSNDVGYAQVFARQVNAHGSEGDALIGISTSGGSENLLEAYRVAREQGLLTIALLGGDGGVIASSGLVAHCLVVNSDSVHRIQETHVIAYHILWDLVHSWLASSALGADK